MRYALLSLLLCTVADAQPAVEGPLDRALAAVGADGRVDYGLLRGRLAPDLDAALAAVANQDPAALRTDAQRTAFLVNAYNAHVLAAVAARPRARHIEREGLFDELFNRPVTVAGTSMTLDHLEHGVLRRQDAVDGGSVPAALRRLRPGRVDYRIHAALNCAAVGCPPLQRRAFRAATLGRDLDRAFQTFAASDRAARRGGDRIVLSSLFDWFAADFETGGRRLGDVLLQAMPEPRARTFRDRLAGKSAATLRRDRSVAFAYDWAINRR